VWRGDADRQDGTLMSFLYNYVSLGLVLLAVLLLLAWRSFRRRDFRALAIVVAAILLWVPFEMSRPFVGHGYVTGTEVRRVERSTSPRETEDVDFIYTRGWGGDQQFRNEDSWLFLKRNADDVYGVAKSIEGKPEEARTFIATGVRNYLASWHPNLISLKPTLAWVVFAAHYLLWLAVFGGLLLAYVRARRPVD
jgi:hypothetical protein